MRRSLLLAVLFPLLALAGCGGNPPSPGHVKHAELVGSKKVLLEPNGHQLKTPGGVKYRSPTFGIPTSQPAAIPPAFSATPTVEFYDAVDVSAIPSGARYVACYASGSWPNCGQMRARFPNAAIKSIATNAFTAAQCLDVEPGDADSSQSGTWIHWMLSREYRPCVYSSISNMGNVRYYISSWGISRSSYLLWAADWTYRYEIIGGYDAQQWYSDNAIDKDAAYPYFFSNAAPVDPRLAKSYNQGYDACYATAMGVPYRDGYGADHKAKPYSAAQFNAGCPPGAKAGYDHAWTLGRSAGDHTGDGQGWNLSFKLGFDFGYATGADRPYYTGFVSLRHSPPTSNSAFNAAWVKGKPKGFNAMFIGGYKAG